MFYVPLLEGDDEIYGFLICCIVLRKLTLYVMDKSNELKNRYARSMMSDQELADIIKHDRQERPMEFENSCSAGSSEGVRFTNVPAVTSVIAKWL